MENFYIQGWNFFYTNTFVLNIIWTKKVNTVEFLGKKLNRQFIYANSTPDKLALEKNIPSFVRGTKYR
jgi:hypothetical protein